MRIVTLLGLCLSNFAQSALSADVFEQVPSPWVPVSVQHGEERTEVGIWGRTYRFAKGPLPVDITTAGQEILDAPMRLAASVDGQPLRIWTVRPSWGYREPAYPLLLPRCECASCDWNEEAVAWAM